MELAVARDGGGPLRREGQPDKGRAIAGIFSWIPTRPSVYTGCHNCRCENGRAKKNAGPGLARGWRQLRPGVGSNCARVYFVPWFVRESAFKFDRNHFKCPVTGILRQMF